MKNGTGKMLLGLGFLLLVMGLGTGCSGPKKGNYGPAQDFELQSLEGTSVSLASYEGKPLVVAFWAVGCPPCRQEAPHLSRLKRDFEGLDVLAINGWDESKSAVKEFVDANELQQTVLLNGSGVASKYGVTGLPTVFWVDKNGTIVGKDVGYHDYRHLKARADELLDS